MFFGSNPIKPQLSEVEFVHKDIDHSTGLFSSIQSSRHSGNSVLCPRSAPSTKRFIRSPTAAPESLLENHMKHSFSIASMTALAKHPTDRLDAAAACLLSNVPELRARNHTVNARTQLRDATVRTVRM